HPQQRLGRTGELLHRPLEIVPGVQGGQRAEVSGQGGRIDGHGDLLHPSRRDRASGPSTAVPTAGSVRHGRIHSTAMQALLLLGLSTGEAGYPRRGCLGPLASATGPVPAPLGSGRPRPRLPVSAPGAAPSLVTGCPTTRRIVSR